MRNLHTLTALLNTTLTVTLRPRLDGTAPADKKDDKTPDKGSGKREMTREQWEAQRRTELADASLENVVKQLIKVEADNYELRRQQAPDGGLVLDGEQRKRWEAFEKLGKPEDIAKAIEQGKKDREAVEKKEKADALASVATAAKWDAETFASLNDMTPGLEWRVQEVGKGDDKIQQAQVKVGDEWKDADTFAEERWKKFLPVLQTADGNDLDPQTPTPRTEVKTPTGGAGGGKSRGYSVEDAEKRLEDSGQYRM
ncbi:hypothetical protein [Deinococcus radiotolerans]|uniref:Uncharacterized protein n=1 Tax=Deinococcus radiotolerans TaxID=1309407 RepID=A0ABQ2FQ47_9DEIO|nr:hypothetical protein [Deinococcus radiotolerans]GGL15801.1 hypothetical protein GCM10010844_38400 [Deinococcus radiotolerans]